MAKKLHAMLLLVALAPSAHSMQLEKRAAPQHAEHGRPASLPVSDSASRRGRGAPAPRANKPWLLPMRGAPGAAAACTELRQACSSWATAADMGAARRGARLKQLNQQLGPRAGSGAAQDPAAQWLTGGGAAPAAAPAGRAQPELVPISAPIATPIHVHPSLCCTADGTLVVVYGMSLPGQSAGNSHGIMCARSVDAGASWTEPEPIECTVYAPAPRRPTPSPLAPPATSRCIPGPRPH